MKENALPSYLQASRLPAAVIVALIIQTAGALLWTGSAAERIAMLERTLSADQVAISRVAVLEEQISAMRQSLSRIEHKLDTSRN